MVSDFLPRCNHGKDCTAVFFANTSVMLTKAELSRLRALREKKHREATGLFVVEGEKVVRELLAANFPFVEIYATDQWDGAKTHELSAAEMAKASHFPTPSSVLAVGRIVRRPLPDRGLAEGLTLALDQVQDPGNVGTLIRIADWYGLDRVVLSPECADLFSQKVINASKGSFARVAIHTSELHTLLANVPGSTPVLGCDLTGDDVHTLEPTKDAVIVIGSEGRGMSPEVRRTITQYVTIPRYGHAESLNAGVAAAIVCDNLRRSLPV